ncbi:MAG: ABC transporter permease [Clostridia bacterium]|nr:ABC transporter permease [Clostridia bacterium]
MRYNVLTYLIGEGFSNVFKNKKQAMTSLAMMCITMLIFGVFFVIGQNLNHFVEQVESKQGIQVYLKKDATEIQIQEMKTQLQSIQGVNTIEYVSKEDALQQMKNKLGEKAYLLKGYEQSNPFPVSYVMTLTDLNLSSQIQEQIKQMDNVDDIRSSDKTINTLVKLARGIKIGTYIILAFLIIFSVFIIANTIKLTVHARRREISIMKYVGATNGFIRWPFAVEGMIIGIISGAASIGILSGIYYLVAQNESFIQFLSKIELTLLQFGDMLNIILIIYLILGIGIGVLGSTISMRKYLKV